MRTIKAQISLTNLRSPISAFVIHCLDSMTIYSFYMQNLQPVASFCGWAGRFESYLVANPKDRSDEAQNSFMLNVQKLPVLKNVVERKTK